MTICRHKWLLACLGAVLVAQAGAIAQMDRVSLPGHVPEIVRALQPIGQLPGTTNLWLAIGLPLRNTTELSGFLEQLQDPRSSNYHRYLTPPEFTERFGPTETEYEAVARFVESYGLRVAARHNNRVVLDVEGSVSNIERAFQVTLYLFRHRQGQHTFFAPDTEPSVPLGLPVESLGGLSDFVRPTPLVRPVDATTANPLNYNGSAPGGGYQGSDFRHAYAAGATLTGSGQTAAVAEFDGYYPQDIATYESDCGYASVPLQNVLVDNVTGSPGYSGIANAVAEVSLDIELLIAMAPGLSKVMVYEGSNPYDVFNRIVTDNLAKQISCSWAWNTGPTHNWGRTGTKTLDSQLQQMAAQGQSFFQASGDSDAYTGRQAISSSAGPIPEDSIYVTSVGGTTLSMTGVGGAWASEIVWNWGNNTGSGGGISPNYAIPSWQTNISMASNSGSTTYRNFPDVAMTADAVYVVYNNGSAAIFGGTSCAAPLWAGFTALINQQFASAANAPAGFLNPALYAIAHGSAYGNCFHDITTGNNIGANTPGLFSAVSGYDLCTGLGTPNGTNLINALSPMPSILLPPVSQTVPNGSNATFSVTAGGQAPLTYRWLFNGTNLSASANVVGVTSNELALLSVTTASAGNYSVVVTNNSGSVTSAAAALTVTFPPSFAIQPTNETVVSGGTAVFNANVSGASPLAFQWQKHGTNLANGGGISGATSNVLTLTAVTLASADNYRLVASNVFGGATSTVVTLTVTQPPEMTLAPAAQTVQCGSNAVFSAAASGTLPLSYQWSVDGAAIAGATGTTLLLTSVHLPNHTVAVVVTNVYGSATSSVTLTVQDTLPPAITLGGGNPFYVELGSAFNDPGATAFDLCAGAVAAIATGAVNTNALSTNTVTYTAKDGSGNTSTATRTVIVRDTTPPIILWSFTNLTLAAGTNCTARMPDLTGTNYILATDLSGTVRITQTPTNGAVVSLGTNPVVLSAADASGNASYSTNTVVVLDESPPLIVSQPQSQTNATGAKTTFSVLATACTPITCQWFFDRAALAEQTNSTLILSNITSAAAGDYFAVATAAGGSSTSAVATLTVDLLSIIGVVPNPNGTVTLELSGALGSTYILEATISLATVNWSPLATNTLSASTVWQVTDAEAASLPQRFYRLRLSQ